MIRGFKCEFHWHLSGYLTWILWRRLQMLVSHNIYWDKEVASLIHWHFEGKEPKFSRSALYVRRSCFKNLAFPCRQGHDTTLTESKASKRQKRIYACIYSSADSYLLRLIGQLSCTQTLRIFTNTHTRRFHMHTIFPLCASDHSWQEVSTSFQGSTRLCLMKLETRLAIPIANQLASQPVSRLCSKMILHSLTWHGSRGRVK